jgi:Ser-tRNA(Ala) deacylase AlaX
MLNENLRFITENGDINTAEIERSIASRATNLRFTHNHRVDLTEGQWLVWALDDLNRQAQGERQLYEMRAIARGIALPPGFYADLYEHQAVGAR